MQRGPCWDVCFDLLIWEWVEGNSIGRGRWAGGTEFYKRCGKGGKEGERNIKGGSVLTCQLTYNCGYIRAAVGFQTIYPSFLVCVCITQVSTMPKCD